MSQRLREEGPPNVIRFPDTLDAFQMVRMRAHLTRVLNRHPKFVLLDLAQTRRVELAGLGMLVERLRRLGNGEGVVRFSNVSPQIHRTLTRAGVEGFLGF